METKLGASPYIDIGVRAGKLEPSAKEMPDTAPSTEFSVCGVGKVKLPSMLTVQKDPTAPLVDHKMFSAGPSGKAGGVKILPGESYTLDQLKDIPLRTRVKVKGHLAAWAGVIEAPRALPGDPAVFCVKVPLPLSGKPHPLQAHAAYTEQRGETMECYFLIMDPTQWKTAPDKNPDLLHLAEAAPAAIGFKRFTHLALPAASGGKAQADTSWRPLKDSELRELNGQNSNALLYFANDQVCRFESCSDDTLTVTGTPGLAKLLASAGVKHRLLDTDEESGEERVIMARNMKTPFPYKSRITPWDMVYMHPDERLRCLDIPADKDPH